MLKGHLDAIVLAALESGPAHGYAIIEAIKSRSGGTFDLPEGTIYPALHRLEQAGLLSSSWTTPPRRPAPPRLFADQERTSARSPNGRKAWGRFSQGRRHRSLGGGRAWPA